MKHIILGLFVILIASFTFASPTNAVCSGMVQCGYIDAQLGCVDDWNSSVACGGASCNAVCANGCEINNGCTATGTDPVTGGCPTECRGGSSCGVGYTSATGCSGNGVGGGCTINQTCCRPTSCPAGGGGSASCGFSTFSCPAGQVKSAVLTTSQCRPQFDNTCAPVGTGQTNTGVCCHSTKTEPSVCGAWYSCPTPSNPTKQCRDCTDEVWECDSYTVNTYSCVSTCSATSPTAPTLSTPTAEQTLVSTSVNLLWTWPVGSTFGAKCPAPNVDQYQVYIDECAASPAAITNPTTLRYTTPNSSTLSYSGYAGFVQGRSYCWKVAATNGGVATSSVTRRLKISGDVTGTVYYDASNNCGGSGWGGALPAVTVSLDSTNASLTGSGTFSITAPDALGHTLSVSIPSGYSCSTGAGCNTCTRSSVVGGSINNFYLTTVREAWWRVQGAPIYAGSSVRSLIPIADYPLIQASAGAGTSGALIRGSGTVDLGLGSASNDDWSTISTYRGKKMNYNYFASHMGVVKNQEADWETDILNLQSYDSSKDFWYADPSLGVASIDSPWTVGVGEKYVVFVNGDLDINSNITVATGGFLAFIVKGDVTIDATVQNLQGLFVMDNNFVTETVYVLGGPIDDQLTVQGSVIAWGSFSLTRNMGASNTTTAVERFYYRQDLLLNMPEKMKSFAMQWQEVPAGSFEE